MASSPRHPGRPTEDPGPRGPGSQPGSRLKAGTTTRNEGVDLSRDRGLLLGDGLFETLLADNGRLITFDQHAARLVRGCARLGLPAPEPARLRGAAEAAIAAADLGDARAAVRLTWTAGDGERGLERPASPTPRLLARAAAAARPETPALLATASIRRNPTSPASRLKTLAYLDNLLARREATAAGADEALMLNTKGEIACAAAANIFWIAEGRLFTPALDCGVLDGIVRAGVMAQAAGLGVTVIEAHEGAEALAAAEAVLITNSLIGVRPVGRLDYRAYAPHALAARLRAACAALR